MFVTLVFTMETSCTWRAMVNLFCNLVGLRQSPVTHVTRPGLFNQLFTTTLVQDPKKAEGLGWGDTVKLVSADVTSDAT